MFERQATVGSRRELMKYWCVFCEGGLMKNDKMFHQPSGTLSLLQAIRAIESDEELKT